MSKPTIDDTRWAVTTGGAEGSNQSNPLTDLKDNGWATNAVPTSGNLNWLFRKIHAWFKFLDPLFSSGGSLTLPAAQTLTVPGDTDLGADLFVGGNANVSGNVNALSDAGFGGTVTADALDITASATIGTTLTVNGNTTLGNAIGDTAAVSGPLTVGSHLTISGSGDLKHAAEWVLPVSPSAFVGCAGSPGTLAFRTSGAPDSRNYLSMSVTTSGTSQVAADIKGIRVGDTITTIDFEIGSISGVMGSYDVAFFRQQRSTTAASGTSVTDGSLSVPTRHTSLTVNYTLIAGETYWIEVTSADTDLFVISAHVHVTHS